MGNAANRSCNGPAEQERPKGLAELHAAFEDHLEKLRTELASTYARQTAIVERVESRD